MKTKIISIILILAAVLSLAGCGTQAAAAPEMTTTPVTSAAADSTAAAEQAGESGEITWVSTFKDVKLPQGMEYVNASAFTDKGFYGISSEKKTNADDAAGEGESYQGCILFTDFEGNTAKLANYEPVSVEHEREGKYNYSINNSPLFVIPLASGDLVEVEALYESWVTEEDLDSSKDEYWENYQYSQEYYFRLLDGEGAEKLHKQIPMEEEQYLSNGTLDRDGNLICIAADRLLVLSPEGELIRTIECGSYCEGIVTLQNGAVCVTTWGDAGMEMMPVDTAKGEIGTGRKLPNGAYNLMAGGGAYPLYYTNGSNFYGYDPESGKGEKLFSWLGTDVSADVYGNLYIDENGTVTGIINEDESYSEDAGARGVNYKLFEVKQVPASSVKQKKTLTLACQWLNYDAGRLVLKFNRSNEEYRIEILDYSEYNTEEDYSAGLTKLLTEIMAGNMPDILDLEGMPLSRLAAKGLLEDLYPFIDADAELSRDRYFPNVLSLCERDGKLLSTVSGFYLSTLIGASSVVGDTPGWTYQEFDAALATMPEGCRPLSAYTTRDQILSICLSLDMNRYVNWATGECNFNTEEFAQLLKFAARFPESFDWDNYDWQTDSDEVNLAAGMQMLSTAWISSPEDIAFNEYYFGGQPYTYIGYPTASGTGNYLSLSSGFAMSSSCSDKAAAWQFLRQFFTDSYQKEQYMLPASKTAYEAKMKEAMTENYKKDSNGD